MANDQLIGSQSEGDYSESGSFNGWLAVPESRLRDIGSGVLRI